MTQVLSYCISEYDVVMDSRDCLMPVMIQYVWLPLSTSCDTSRHCCYFGLHVLAVVVQELFIALSIVGRPSYTSQI